MTQRGDERLAQLRASVHRFCALSDRGRTTVLGIALLALSSAACQGTPPPASLSPDDLISLQQAERIIQSDLTAGEHALINNATSVVTEQCMQQLGWDFQMGRETPETNSGGPESLSPLDQWTFADVEAAETEGYGLDGYFADLAAHLDLISQLDSEARIPDPTTMNTEDAARFELDYFGRDEDRVEIVERDGSNTSIAGGGCLGTAFRAVWGDIAQELSFRDARGTAQSEIWVTTLADGAVATALSAWKSCVGKAGFQFENPQEAFENAFVAAQSGDFQRQRVIATTDSSCKAESGLDRAIESAFLVATNTVLPDLEEDLIAYQQFEAASLERAKDILGLGD